MEKKLKVTKKRIAILIIILVIIFFFPKNVSTCRGDRICFGWKTYNSETWLNIKDSVFERRTGSPICIGIPIKLSMIMDGCPGDWGYANERPINCKDLRDCYATCSSGGGPEEYCDIDCEKNSDTCKSENLKYGIKYSEWRSVCEKIKYENRVPIKIENISETYAKINS